MTRFMLQYRAAGIEQSHISESLKKGRYLSGNTDLYGNSYGNRSHLFYLLVWIRECMVTLTMLYIPSSSRVL